MYLVLFTSYHNLPKPHYTTAREFAFNVPRHLVLAREFAFNVPRHLVLCIGRS